MCRAQGIPHQKVSRCEELQPALHSAWALHRHSVVEVITGRDSNVNQHRQLQTAVQHAVKRAIKLLTDPMPGQSFGRCMLLTSGGPGVHCSQMWHTTPSPVTGAHFVSTHEFFG